MKKIYMTPQTEVSHLKVFSNLCAGTVTGGTPNNPINDEGEEAKNMDDFQLDDYGWED